MRKQLLHFSWKGINQLKGNTFLKIFNLTFALLLLTVVTASAQDERQISGRVTADGEGIPGVTVIVKGTSIGTATDSLGNYTITVPNSDAVLVFDYLGYKTKEVAVGDLTEVTVGLESDAEAEEVVVVGYGTRKKEDLTGSVTSVSSDELNEVVVVNPVQALQGRAPGVQVTQNSGTPGAPVTVRVRGVGSLNNSDPLYVVNGIPVSNIGDINTNDIASMSVLKDASAAAIYGSRAANGVIVITTKSGSKTKSSVDFNMLTGVSREWKRLNLLDAREWATLRNEASMADNGTVEFDLDTIPAGSGTDWQDEIFQKGHLRSYQLGAGGGSEKANYYISGSYLSQEGILKNSDYKRYNFNTHADYQLAKRLKVGTFINLAFFNRSQLYDVDPYNAVIATALNMDPITPVYSRSNHPDSLYASGSDRTDVPNPLARLAYQTNKFRGLNALGRFYGEYEIISGLKARSSFGYSRGAVTNNQFNARYYVDPNHNRPQSEVVMQQNNNRLWVWENSVEYEKTINEDHEIGAMFLYAAQDNRSENFRAVNTNTPNNDPSSQFLDVTSGTATATGGAAESALLSYMVRVNYDFKNKYSLTANARRDGSSKFPRNNRWGTFPSFAAAWKISEEGFFEGLRNNISFLKLRASWGKLGNQNIVGGEYPYTTNVQSGYNYTFGGNPAYGSTPLGAGNPDIKWETVTMSNVALDFGFFNNRLLFTADYFIKRTSDMLFRPILPGYTGIEEAPFVNGAEMVNRGIELLVDYNNKIGEINYGIVANFTKIKNKVTQLDNPIVEGPFRTVYTNYTQEGGSVGEFYGYVTDGIVQTEEEAANLQSAQPNVRPGDFKFKDLNGDGKITEADQQSLGSPLPKFTYGFSGEVAFKGFDLNIFFQGSYGNKIFNGSKYTLEGGIPFSNMSDDMLDRWHGPGTSNTTPRVSNEDPNNNRRVSDYYIESGSYLRVRSLALGYTLPNNISEIIRVPKLRLFVMAQNLFTFTKYSGLDPEIGVFTPDPNYTRSFLDLGVDKGGTYPQARTWMFGLNASF